MQPAFTPSMVDASHAVLHTLTGQSCSVNFYYSLWSLIARDDLCWFLLVVVVVVLILNAGLNDFSS